MEDFGKSFGDSMSDADMVQLDGDGFGGEFQTDTGDVETAEVEAETNIGMAEIDGVFSGPTLDVLLDE